MTEDRWSKRFNQIINDSLFASDIHKLSFLLIAESHLIVLNSKLLFL
jgi:hypothetical protein